MCSLGRWGQGGERSTELALNYRWRGWPIPRESRFLISSFNTIIASPFCVMKQLVPNPSWEWQPWKTRIFSFSSFNKLLCSYYVLDLIVAKYTYCKIHHLSVLKSKFMSVKHISVTTQPIPRIFLIWHNWHSVPIKQLPISPNPSNHHFTFCPYKSAPSRALGEVESYCICLLESGLFHWSTMSSRFVQVVSCVRISFCFKAEWCSAVCIDHNVYPSICWRTRGSV